SFDALGDIGLVINLQLDKGPFETNADLLEPAKCHDARADGISSTSKPIRAVVKIPRIQTPQDDRLDSEFATELGQILSPHDGYCLYGHAVKVATDHDNLSVFEQSSAEEFCTLIEEYCVPSHESACKSGTSFFALCRSS